MFYAYTICRRVLAEYLVLTVSHYHTGTRRRMTCVHVHMTQRASKFILCGTWLRYVHTDMHEYYLYQVLVPIVHYV